VLGKSRSVEIEARVVVPISMNPAHPNPPRILIADDQENVLEAPRLLLKGEGFRTVSVNSPAAALTTVRTEEFDAALIDLNYARDTTSGALADLAAPHTVSRAASLAPAWHIPCLNRRTRRAGSWRVHTTHHSFERDRNLRPQKSARDSRQWFSTQSEGLIQ
jgi:hypothetical protein